MTRSCWWQTNAGSTSEWRPGKAFSLDLLQARAGFALLRVKGARVVRCFGHEAGGHRWQRVPPTDKRGRVQTSTISVAVLSEPAANQLRIDPRDLDESFTRGSGSGGQHRNKTDTAVVLVHRPSGLRVRIDGGRSQHHNRQSALAVLRARLCAEQSRVGKSARNQKRREQVGSGMRADKIRTVRVRQNQVIDHRTGRRTSFKRYLRGMFDGLRD